MTNKEIAGIWVKGSGDAAPYIRKKFNLKSTPQKAILNLCGLGWHEVYVNGKKADDRVLAPVVTQFDKHISYIEYDITEHLKSGANAITVVLGNGWYNCQTEDAWNFQQAPWRDEPKLLCELLCDEHLILCSDKSWKTHSSPTIFNALRNGETYDARKEITGVYEADFDDSKWENAVQICPPGGVLCKEQMEPCKVMQTLKAVKETRLQHNVIVYDFGVNITGWCQIKVEGDAGVQIKIEYGEMIRDNQDLDRWYIDTLVKSGEFQTDCYYLKGDGIESWQPRFTYHGFRYTKVNMWGGDINIKSIRACCVHNSFDSVGSFECSNNTVNKLQEITRRSYLGNFTGIPTDCPHREKNGWTGDAQLACETGLWNFAAKEAYKNYNRILADTQRLSGQLPGIAPSGGWGFNWGSGPAWDICLFELPYQVYRFTGDKEMISEHYEAMHKYVDYCKGMARNNLVNFGLGDWCHVDKSRIAPIELTSSAYYFYAVKLLAYFAKNLGDDKDYQEYSKLSSEISGAINRKYANSDGSFAGGEWTALACVLYFGIAPEKNRKQIADLLAQKVTAHEYKIDFGILGAKYVPRVLADYGHIDVAFKLLTQREFPGWGYWIEMGATTLWEQWSGTDSRNHIMFGDVSAWFYQYLAGIIPDENNPGFSKLTIKPTPVEGLKHCKATYKIPSGKVFINWQIKDNRFSINLKVPVNAELILPNTQTIKIDPGKFDYEYEMRPKR